MNPRISPRKPEDMRSNRIRSFNNFAMKKSFDNLDLLMGRFKVVESTVFNVDETETYAVQKHPKMLWPEDQEEVGAAIF
jgi:hypothetical protein